MAGLRTALLSCSALMVGSLRAFAQEPATPQAFEAWDTLPTTQSSSLYDPGQLPVFKGEVELFTLTPRGDIDGFVLKDGTEVKTPPHLTSEVAFAIKPGDTVTTHGLKAASLPLIQATSITDDVSAKTVVDNGPGSSGKPLPPTRETAPPPPPRRGFGATKRRCKAKSEWFCTGRKVR